MALAVTGSASGPTLPPGPFDALSAVYHAGQLDADALVGDSLTVVSGGPVVPEVSVGSGDVGTGVGVLSVVLVSMVVGVLVVGVGSGVGWGGEAEVVTVIVVVVAGSGAFERSCGRTWVS